MGRSRAHRQARRGRPGRGLRLLRRRLHRQTGPRRADLRQQSRLPEVRAQAARRHSPLRRRALRPRGVPRRSEFRATSSAPTARKPAAPRSGCSGGLHDRRIGSFQERLSLPTSNFWIVRFSWRAAVTAIGRTTATEALPHQCADSAHPRVDSRRGKRPARRSVSALLAPLRLNWKHGRKPLKFSSPQARRSWEFAAMKRLLKPKAQPQARRSSSSRTVGGTPFGVSRCGARQSYGGRLRHGRCGMTVRQIDGFATEEA